MLTTEQTRYPCVQQGCCDNGCPCAVVEIGDGITASHYQVCCFWALETKKTCDCGCHVCLDPECRCLRHWEPQSLTPIQAEELARWM